MIVPDRPLTTAPSTKKSAGTTTSPSRRKDSSWPSRTSCWTRDLGTPSIPATSSSGIVTTSALSSKTSFTTAPRPWPDTVPQRRRVRHRLPGRYRRAVNAPTAALLDSRYRVEPMIARGGMSTVYRGTDIRLDRPVAIKILDSRLAADPVFRRRGGRGGGPAPRPDPPHRGAAAGPGDGTGPL